MSQLELDRIRVAYPTPGGLLGVIDGLSLQLRRGEIGCLLGRSGCGKTTVLRAIAGFEPVRAGRIVLDGTVLASTDAVLPPERRRVGMMFQDYALFPHLDVAANVAFGLRRSPRDRRQTRVGELLELVGLTDKARAWPHELSGGQQQRVALARALAPEPALLLLDEPFSNLDIHTREHLAGELRGLLRAAGTTALLVTHDQAEAFAMADHVGVMHQGRILQWADAATLYRKPADRFVAGFIGRGGLVPAAALGLEGEGEVLLRPEHLRFAPDGPISARLLERTFRGPGSVCLLELAGGGHCEADLPLGVVAAAGDELRFQLLDEELPRF
ncbi:ABC transporter ATP-binding protein [Marilutibacter alkalisoli]|uniref:ABC transporter ATP-binding protein n=1 Tax=Marilutibacter alkalisoli TaxID=2591633 RepID=A0A514BQ01_9GAMM|nr:ABC transporter ATP-binding protein [Lysobacter alkalisoli]QDH69474.1 ABC transporter ATP-binding protein [Lysobacter alkalisoli]